jgi:hypothetical protein
MRKSSQKLLTVCVVAICLALPLSFVTGRINGLVFGGMFGGRILDQETNQPVSGAYVIATWADYSFNRTTCVHMDIDITDKQGHYFFSPWVDTVGRIVVSQESSMVVVYAPGYEQVTYVGSLYVRKYRGTPKERIKQLNRISSLFCGSGSEELPKKKRRVRKDMYFEAKESLESVSDDPGGKFAYRVEFLRRKCGESCQ